MRTASWVSGEANKETCPPKRAADAYDSRMDELIVSPHRNWGKRLLAALLWALVALVFGACAWLFGIEPIATALGNWQVAKDYRETDAKVVTRGAKDADGSTVNWVAAEYVVDGKTYLAERMSVLDDDGFDNPVNAAAAQKLESARSANAPAKIWVSPRRPEIALVSRDLPLGALLPRAPMAIGFAFIAIAGVAGFIGALVNFGYYRKLHAASGMWLFAGVWCGFMFPILLLVSTARDVEFWVVVFVGFFALIGLGLLWSAISSSFTGNVTGVKFGSSPGSKLPASALRTTGGYTKKIDKTVKRGGLGGRGDGVDKN